MKFGFSSWYLTVDIRQHIILDKWWCLPVPIADTHQRILEVFRVFLFREHCWTDWIAKESLSATERLHVVEDSGRLSWMYTLFTWDTVKPSCLQFVLQMCPCLQMSCGLLGKFLHHYWSSGLPNLWQYSTEARAHQKLIWKSLVYGFWQYLMVSIKMLTKMLIKILFNMWLLTCNYLSCIWMVVSFLAVNMRSHI